MTFPKPNSSFYFTIVLFTSFIIFIIVIQRRIKKEGILLNAKTTHWASGSKMSLDLKYEFEYNGKMINGANAFEPFRGNPDFENRYFPVLFYPGLGGHSRLLIRPSDFNDVNIPFPDSLKWVLKYLDN